jgi:ABC-type phosphate/phosphonate transport system permease subunit
VISCNFRSGSYPSKQLLLLQVKQSMKLAAMCVGGIAFLYALYLCSENLFGSQQPNNIASRVFDIVRNTDEIVATTGEKECP